MACLLVLAQLIASTDLYMAAQVQIQFVRYRRNIAFVARYFTLLVHPFNRGFKIGTRSKRLANYKWMREGSFLYATENAVQTTLHYNLCTYIA